MARRYHNSLEKPSHRRGRFRRGVAFGFFGISLIFAIIGWVISAVVGDTGVWHPRAWGAIAVPAAIAGIQYTIAVIVGETNQRLWIERLWLGTMSASFALIGIWLIFVGAIFAFDTLFGA